MRWCGWFREDKPAFVIDDAKFIEFQKLVVDELPEGYVGAVMESGGQVLISSFLLTFYLTHLDGTDGANGYAWQCKNAIVKGFPLVSADTT